MGKISVLWCLLLVPACIGAAQTPSRPLTRSPHGKLATPCENCHTFSSWRPLRQYLEFNHNRTSYPLRGNHAGVACRQCHTRLIFSNTSSRCADCHADMHRRQFGAACERCHTVKGWQEVRAQQQHQNRFPLLGAHAVQTCDACHKGAATGQFAGLSINCLSCHAADYARTSSPNHGASSFSTACQTCHSMDGWPGAKFDHLGVTRFALGGAHARLNCSACHAAGNFQGAKADCFSCHAKDFASTSNPDHTKAGLPQQCSQCHTTENWNGAKFDHTALTKFPLTGQHVSQTCTACHATGAYAGLSTACAACHLANYNNTQNPNHRTAGLPQTCERCHTTTGWNSATMDHSLTKFPLTGAHLSVACALCHSNGQYTGTAAACASCHISNYNATTNPNHKAAAFPQTCDTCHTTFAWTPASLDHLKTGFALTGAHTTVGCALCHVNNVYAGTSPACLSCHINNYNATTNPNHKAAGYPTDCALCHTTTTFTGAKVAHTSWPLTGMHTSLQCSQCHSDGVYAGKSTACASCHLALYNAQTNPNHKAAGFSTDCAQCHTTASFATASFAHGTWPLTGTHKNLQCSQCHSDGVYAGKATACNSCHTSDYNGTTNPNHKTAGFPTDCALCHTTSTFTGATFAHTTWPLTGLHKSLQCSQCHSDGVYAAKPTACSTCHLNDYNGTTNPNHKAAGFPTDCSVCHSTAGWPGAAFNHATTAFPLTGAHTSQSCTTCHSTGVYAGLSTACVSCHLANYNGTTNPNHKTAGFPQICNTCHTTNAWIPSTFSHASTAFPLTGRHTTVACSNCHVNGVYAGTPKDCYACHKSDYSSVSNPNHVAAGFPTTCTTCHTTAGWTGATFNHTWFPIYGSGHAGRWHTCADCHTNPSDYAVFSCTGCHSKSSTDSHHSGVRNYVYNSANCYSCHPQGRAG